MKLDSSRSLLIRLLVLAVLVLVPPALFVSLHAQGQFEQGIIPEMDKKAAAIGRDVGAQVERAVSYGIPIARLVGVDEFFSPILAANTEFRYLAVTDLRGRVLFLKGAELQVLEPHYRAADFESLGDGGLKASIGPYWDLALPVEVKGERVGQVHVGFDQSYVRERLFDIQQDIMVLLAAFLLVVFEILLFVVFFNITGPLKAVRRIFDQVGQGDFGQVPATLAGDEVGRFMRRLAQVVRALDDRYRRLMAYVDEIKTEHFDKDVVGKVGEIEARINGQYRFSPTGKPEPLHERRGTDLRLALFMFVFAEEMGRAFMPLYAQDLARGSHGLSMEMTMAIPIALFMACIALATPWAGALVGRLGARRVFLLGMIPAVLGYVMTGLAWGVADLVFWRALTGIGYAVVTMACQSYMSDAEGRGSGLGVYVGAVLTASICGTAIGGILAERMGFRATFALSALLVLLSGWLVSRVIEATPPAGGDGQSSLATLRRLVLNLRFNMLMVFAAMPSKLALTGFFFFLVPVLLTRAQFELADVARMMVLYPLVMVLVSLAALRLNRLVGRPAILVAAGGLIGGLGLAAPWAFGPSPGAVGVAIVALGLSQGLSASPLLALVPDICREECDQFGKTAVLAAVRLVERVGSTIGPIFAALFMPSWGVKGAVVALCVAVLSLAVIFALAARSLEKAPKPVAGAA